MLRSSLIALASVVGLGGVLSAQQRTESPHGQLQEQCALCHSPDGWRPAKVSKDFNHAKWGFALEGAHEQTACSACHASLDFSGAPKECVACHQDVHRGEFGADCSRCHTPRSFVDRSGMLRMHQTTRFPLTGVHLVADCESCHAPSAQGQFTFVNRGTACQDCHMQSFLATTNPNHQATGFSLECSQCHAVTTWTAPASTTTREASRSPAPTGPCVVPIATPGTPSPARRPTAWAAIRTITTTPRTRPMPAPGSRPTAPSVTRPRPGRTPPSTTTRPGSS